MSASFLLKDALPSNTRFKHTLAQPQITQNSTSSPALDKMDTSTFEEVHDSNAAQHTSAASVPWNQLVFLLHREAWDRRHNWP
ncbi:hypothetical protein BaRGS_00018354 [Batillaria attramentaria]|uniref:Uncharacterized protein n=1 Tax=Batillaria attramentaria TaxID=370345 RepID=A0ABD0KU57_9CAEN